MAAKRHERIEPTFSGPADDEFRISADDRAVPPAANDIRRKASRKSAKAGSASGSRDRSRRGRSSGSGGSGGGRRRRSFIGHMFRLFVLLGMVGGLAVAGLVGYVAFKLPQEAWAIPDRPPNVKIVSVTGDVLANRGLTGGKAVALDEISPYVPQAVIAIEDRRFYDHYGIDPVGIVRAFFENMAAGETVQGGSTLTQQLAKNIFLSPEQSMERKLQEAVLALWLEHKFTKDQILEMYLNRVYFGSGATGIEAAAGRYFDKPASELDLAEAALLAGLLKAPSRLSPARDPEAAKARAEVVLAAMRDTGFIGEAELADARAQKPTNARSYWNGAEHYAADVVMRDILDLVGQVKEDVIVETTIDLGLERAAEKAIRATVDGAKQNVSQGALVAVDGTGAIRAMVGGRDYAQSQFNRAVDAKRQPGSTFKPFVYAAAIEAGWRPETVIEDGPVRIGNWSPQNYDNRFRGPVTLADALRQSLNTVAAKLVEAVGAPAVIEMAGRLGVGSALVENASIALGTSEVSLLELTGAFAPFANGGYRATPHLVNRVTSEDGKVLWERGAEVPPIIVSPEVVGMMNAMMTQVVTSGTGQRAAIDGWQAAGKTGTTQDFKDAWFVGYTANLVTGVWLGNDNGANMQKVTGGTLPAQAWHAFMVAAHEGLPATPLPGDYRIGEQEAPLTADSGYGEGGYYDPAAPDSGYYYDGQGGAPVPPGDIPRGAIISDGPPPPGLTVEGRVDGGRPSDQSLFRRIFGG
ncbi:MAG: transglycosylase domain-containing protein [Aurantimonas endophytica]|uniref:Penicillin-binding protein 1A n=1 Tax=Aurantimonas endophytica TaxID=1522175 RepID=A0A7W6HHV7_9HYPH|nr:transglycosylase domain-containing protein [Aurantimonas endophytica]MBB4005232.1 penicillin-binding protein 1A [Aurantimonas endophytica]MCO6406105.1 PBP1A family penicillin-binding protein [Aurantimonas endophytica]